MCSRSRIGPRAGNSASLTRTEARRTALAVALALSSVTNASRTQWTVTNLHPPGLFEGISSHATGTNGTQQVGYLFHPAFPSHMTSAALWSGTAASYVSLAPTPSSAFGISDTHQAGHAEGGARLWNGTPRSWVDLQPAGAGSSAAYGSSGTQQVGAVSLGGTGHASLWSGTTESWVDLHPVGAVHSAAWGIFGSQQVGWWTADLDGVFRASLWYGTAQSWVDLHPAGATESSANGTSGTQQAGYAEIRGARHASLWSGTAESWVDLNPAGAVVSEINAIFGNQQVGNAFVGGVQRAGLWNGTAESWVDLNAFLPDGFQFTSARGIWSDGVRTYIAGEGLNTLTNRTEALLWISSVTGDLNSDGDVDGIDLALLLGAWGTCGDCAECSADLDDDCDTDGFDLAMLLGAWG